MPIQALRTEHGIGLAKLGRKYDMRQNTRLTESQLRKFILEYCDEMEPVNSYPVVHTHDTGRMFDYGNTKSDSHEGRMTRAKLFRMGKMAQSFHDRLEDGDDLPQWVNDKITTAEDRLRAAYDYIEYKIHRMNLSESQIRSVVRNAIVSLNS